MSIRRPQPRNVSIPVVVRVTDRDGKPQGPPHRAELHSSLPLDWRHREPGLHIEGHERGFGASVGPHLTGLRVEPARLWLRVTGDARWDLEGAHPLVYGSECEGVTVEDVLEAWRTAAAVAARSRRESAERERKEAEALAASEAESERERRERAERVCRHAHRSGHYVCSLDRGHDGYHRGTMTDWAGQTRTAHWDDAHTVRYPEREREQAEYRERCRRAEARACPSTHETKGWCLNSRGHDGMHRGLGGVWSDDDVAQAADANGASSTASAEA